MIFLLTKLITLTKHLASHLVAAISASVRLLNNSAKLAGSSTTEDLINLIIVFYHNLLSHSVSYSTVSMNLLLSLISLIFISAGMLTQESTV